MTPLDADVRDAASAQTLLREASTPVAAAVPSPDGAPATRAQRQREKRCQLPRATDMCRCDEIAEAKGWAEAKQWHAEVARTGVFPPVQFHPATLPRTKSVRGRELCVECNRWVPGAWNAPRAALAAVGRYASDDESDDVAADVACDFGDDVDF